MFKVLCVGGPLDGQMRVIQHGNKLTVPIAKGFKWPGELGTAPDPDEPGVEIEYFTYQLHPFSSRDSDDVFWIAGNEYFSALEVLGMLMVGYHDLVDRFNKMKEY